MAETLILFGIFVTVGIFLDTYHITNKSKNKLRTVLTGYYLYIDNLVFPDIDIKANSFFDSISKNTIVTFTIIVVFGLLTLPTTGYLLRVSYNNDMATATATARSIDEACASGYSESYACSEPDDIKCRTSTFYEYVYPPVSG